MISFLIITYNSQEHIEKCLFSVFENSPKSPVVVIDNNSQDNSVETARSIQNGNLILIENKKNIGFAAAVNQGIKYIMENFPNTKHFFLLNPDAYLKKQCLDKMIDELNKDKNFGLISPLIINPDTQKPWFSGAKISQLKQKTFHFKTTNCSSTLLANTHYLSGCALMIKKAVIDTIGFFDERFFLYYEDADFSLRANKAGLKIGIIPNAICYHQESQSSDSQTKTYYLVKSGLLFFHKCYSNWALPWFWTVFWTRWFYHKYFSQKTVVLKAMKDFLSTVD
jgi:GT2 family glycosyltransferase